MLITLQYSNEDPALWLQYNSATKREMHTKLFNWHLEALVLCMCTKYWYFKCIFKKPYSWHTLYYLY